MSKDVKGLNKLQLTMLFSTMVFLIMLMTIPLVFGCMYLLWRAGAIDPKHLEGTPLIIFAIISLVIGTVISLFLSRRPLKPLQEIMNAADRIAGGDYSARIHLRGPAKIRQLGDSFNHMAEEIGSVEMLRTDFVNNFSHEFKTPIVSIRGFAKMLKNNDLTPEEREEYLDIIIGESERLTDLATNVLNLSKVEQQAILTDKAQFNVSEQIRLVIAMLDRKFSKKQIGISFDCGEVFLNGNEELLKQVWINLLDNSIKFSPENETVEVCIFADSQQVHITFTDHGEGMPQETASRVFDKFYQGDASHTLKGNGLGLTIARRIVALHNGSIKVASTNETGTTFEVCLPLH